MIRDPSTRESPRNVSFRLISFRISLSIHGWHCDSLDVDHGMFGDVTDSNLALNLSQSSSVSQSSLTKQFVEKAQSVIARMLVLQVLGRGGANTVYIICSKPKVQYNMITLRVEEVLSAGDITTVVCKDKVQ